MYLKAPSSRVTHKPTIPSDPLTSQTPEKQSPILLKCIDNTPSLAIIEVVCQYLKIPLQKVPSTNGAPLQLEIAADRILTHAIPIALFLSANSKLGEGYLPNDKSLILQWMNFARDTVHNAMCSICSTSTTEQPRSTATNLALDLMATMNGILKNSTFLVGERLSLADVFMAIEFLPLCQSGRLECSRERFPNLFRWLNTCIHRKEFSRVLGNIPRLS